MKTFKDSTGREWELALTIGSAKRVKDKLGLDLLQPELGTPPLLTRLGTEELLLAEVLCCLLEPQFEKHLLTESEVFDTFDGKTLLNAHSAFYEELADFFLSRGRADRSTTVTAQQKAIERAVKAVTAQIEQIDIDAEIDREIRGNNSGNSLAVSDSTPAV